MDIDLQYIKLNIYLHYIEKSVRAAYMWYYGSVWWLHKVWEIKGQMLADRLSMHPIQVYYLLYETMTVLWDPLYTPQIDLNIEFGLPIYTSLR